MVGVIDFHPSHDRKKHCLFSFLLMIVKCIMIKRVLTKLYYVCWGYMTVTYNDYKYPLMMMGVITTNYDKCSIFIDNIDNTSRRGIKTNKREEEERRRKQGRYDNDDNTKAKLTPHQRKEEEEKR